MCPARGKVWPEEGSFFRRPFASLLFNTSSLSFARSFPVPGAVETRFLPAFPLHPAPFRP